MDDPAPLATIDLDPGTDRTGAIWHVEVAGLPSAFVYSWRIDDDPRPVLDPYAPALTGGEAWGWDTPAARGLLDGSELRWRIYRGLIPGALPPPLPPRARPAVAAHRRVIYEAHVRGYTRHPSSGVDSPGTLAGLIEKLPWLERLGVTTLELLPVAEFDETENRRFDPETGNRLVNFWGYSPVSFFAVKAAWGRRPGLGRELFELRALVDAAHQRGMEVVLDVVFNHTAEAGLGAGDPLRSFALLAPEVYYLLGEHGSPIDLTGCGHTLRLQHPVVRRLVIDALRFQAERLGVDGFRFDLAATFFRDDRGEPLDRSPLAEEIAADDLLGRLLLIAEPWDLGGLDVGDRLPPPWRVWNGRFRDAVRRAGRGDAGLEVELGWRLAGSPDRFGSPRRGVGVAARSIDFVTCHDGFTLADLVSYTVKRNLANGEDDRDGANENLSSNAGVEGPTDDPAILAVRLARRRVLLSLLLLSRGTPMLLAGDEFGRTQAGNNNAWCRDDEIGWVVWPTPGEWGGEGELTAWIRALIALRHEFAPPQDEDPSGPLAAVTAAIGELRNGSAALIDLNPAGGSQQRRLLAFNGGNELAVLPLPHPPAGCAWAQRLDTAPESPAVTAVGQSPHVADETVAVSVAPISLRVFDAVRTA